MSLKQIIAVLILGSSSLAVADTAPATTTTTATEPAKDPQRMWTNQAAEMYATKGNVANKPAVTDPGVWVTAGRDPHNKR